MQTNSHRQAMSLIELIVVLAIIGNLIAILISAVHKARAAANRLSCSNNMRQIGLATHSFHDTQQRLPPGQVGPFIQQPFQPYYGWGPESYGWSWLAQILPYIEQSATFENGRITQRTLRQSGIVQTVIPAFICPSSSELRTRTDAGNLDGFVVAVTCYKGVSGANWGFSEPEKQAVDTFWKNPSAEGSYDGMSRGDGAMFRSDVKRPLQLDHITDGTSQTFLIGEDVPEMNRWCTWAYANNAYGTCAIPPNAKKPDGRPFDSNDWGNTWAFRSRHAQGLQFTMADGSVRFIRDSISLATYRALATIRGGEVIIND